jgi:hypothetical protein
MTREEVYRRIGRPGDYRTWWTAGDPVVDQPWPPVVRLNDDGVREERWLMDDTGLRVRYRDDGRTVYRAGIIYVRGDPPPFWQEWWQRVWRR